MLRNDPLVPPAARPVPIERRKGARRVQSPMRSPTSHETIGQLLARGLPPPDARTSLQTLRDLRMAHVAWRLVEGDCVEGADRVGRTPLMIAAAQGDVDLAGLLLHVGALSRATDRRGNTAAHWATYAPAESLADVFFLLVSHGADLNARNNSGCTPLHFADDPAMSEHAAEALRDAGAKPELERLSPSQPPHSVSKIAGSAGAASLGSGIESAMSFGTPA